MQRLKTVYYFVTLSLFTLVMFIVFVAAWVLTVLFDKNRVVSHAVSRLWSTLFFRIAPGWSVEVTGVEHAKHGESYVVVSNHQAMLDIPLLYVLPFNFKWVSKREVYKIPVFGWILWMHGDVAIERGGAASARKMIKDCKLYLDRGVSVIMFPEGTRTKTGCVNAFKEGAMALAIEARKGILPVVIDGTYDAFGKSKRGSVRITSPHKFRVNILPVISADAVSKSSVKELRDTLSVLMSDTHREMVPERYENEGRNI